MAAGLCPDPLGELKRSPRPPSRNKWGLLLRGGKGPEGKGREGGRGGRREGEGGTCSKVLGGIDAPGGLRTSTCQSNIVYACERTAKGHVDLTLTICRNFEFYNFTKIWRKLANEMYSCVQLLGASPPDPLTRGSAQNFCPTRY